MYMGPKYENRHKTNKGKGPRRDKQKPVMQHDEASIETYVTLQKKRSQANGPLLVQAERDEGKVLGSKTGASRGGGRRKKPPFERNMPEIRKIRVPHPESMWICTRICVFVSPQNRKCKQMRDLRLKSKHSKVSSLLHPVCIHGGSSP